MRIDDSLSVILNTVASGEFEVKRKSKRVWSEDVESYKHLDSGVLRAHSEHEPRPKQTLSATAVKVFS